MRTLPPFLISGGALAGTPPTELVKSGFVLSSHGSDHVTNISPNFGTENHGVYMTPVQWFVSARYESEIKEEEA